MTTACDDYGRFDADPRVILSLCFPLRGGVLKQSEVQRWRDEWVEAGLVSLYEVKERLYGVFSSWFTYQRRRDSKSKFPAPEDGSPQSAATCGNPPQLAATRGSRAHVREPRAESREPSTTLSSAEPAPALDHVSSNGFKAEAGEILDFLNRKTGRTFRRAPATLRLIEARLKSGATRAQIQAVIAVKAGQWKADPMMAKFLRPETLFGATKFESYLGELPPSAFTEESAS